MTNTATEKQDVLRQIKLGGRIAEEESEHLAAYFVETEQWRRVWAGEVDIVYGQKGAGKSAIYSTLVARENELFDRDILIAPAVNPRGSDAFDGIVDDPPTGEREFVGLWKIYFLLLIADQVQNYSLLSEQGERLLRILADANLRTGGRSLRTLLASARAYARKILRPNEIEPSIQLDPNSGSIVALTTRIRFEEPSAAERAAGAVQIDELFALANETLAASDYNVWLLLDRLDVAFEGSSELETNALRALFRVYLDLMPYSRLSLKIFLRTDIWRSITQQGFREASHITRDIYLKWDRASLLRLVVQRFLQNDAVLKYYSIEPDKVLANTGEQERFFESAFPAQVEKRSKEEPHIRLVYAAHTRRNQPNGTA